MEALNPSENSDNSNTPSANLKIVTQQTEPGNDQTEKDPHDAYHGQESLKLRMLNRVSNTEQILAE
ncbi:MAG: hypothetical protein ACON4O_03465 [Lentimonas sp.]